MEADTDNKRMSHWVELMEAGAFKETIDSVYPLAQAEDAFQHQLKPGKRGKILIDFSYRPKRQKHRNRHTQSVFFRAKLKRF